MVGDTEYEHSPLVLRVMELLSDEKLRIQMSVHGDLTDEEANALADELFDLAGTGEFWERGQEKKHHPSCNTFSTRTHMVNGARLNVTFFSGREEDAVIVVKGGKK